MPTHTITTTLKLAQEQRTKIAEAITSIHSVEVNAPRYFVQVIFHETEAGTMFIGGEPAPNGHVWVNSLIRAGRTRQQKAKILLRIMQDTSNILHVPTENVWVYISDIPAEGVAEYGVILPQPGNEQQWIESLPEALRNRLIMAN